MLAHGRSIRPRFLVLAALVGGLLLAGVATLTVGSRAGARGDEGCTNATLRGTYEFVAQGVFYAGPNGVPTIGGTRIDVVSVGVASFDGTGKTSTSQTVSIGGQISRGIGAHATAGPTAGIYEVRPDCTGTSASPLGTYDFVIVDHGREFHSVAADSGLVIHIDAVRQ